MLGPLPDERLIYRAADGQVYYPHTDRRGSTVALSQAGQAVETYAYDEFGRSGSTGTSGYPYRYTGQRLDPYTGTYHYKAREYAPQLGRFLQADPARFVDGPNVYAYVGNNPWNAADPTGMCGTRDPATNRCVVTNNVAATDPDYAQAKAEAFRLERELNALDVQVSALDPNSSITYADGDGISRTVTGAQFRAVWNSTDWSVNAQGATPPNGGIGAITPQIGGRFAAQLIVGTVSRYEGMGAGGRTFLALHEISHATPAGQAAVSSNWLSFVAGYPAGFSSSILEAKYPSSAQWHSNERSASFAAYAFAGALSVGATCNMGPAIC